MFSQQMAFYRTLIPYLIKIPVFHMCLLEVYPHRRLSRTQRHIENQHSVSVKFSFNRQVIKEPYLYRLRNFH